MNKTMKKSFAWILTLLLSVGLFTGCGSSKETEDTSSNPSQEVSSESEEATTKTIDTSGIQFMNDGVLTIGVEIGYPPFEDFAEDGTTPVGYDIDIATEVASRLGLEVNFINTAWDGIFAGIDKNYDCVCSAVTINAKRKKTMLFSEPYINNYQAVVVPTGSDLDIKGFTDLDGMTIAVQKETTSDELMSDYKSTGSIDVEIVANEKVTSCFTQLTNGEIDTVVVDSTVADGYVAKEPDKYTIIYKDDSEPEQFGIAMGKENTALHKSTGYET